MSRRRDQGESKASPLDQRYDELGLLRPAEAARRLGVHPDVLGKFNRAGQVPSVSFDWGNQSNQRHGYRPDDIADLARRMWSQ